MADPRIKTFDPRKQIISHYFGFVTFRNSPYLVSEWCSNYLVTFKTVKRFGNKKYKVWCQWLKLLSRSESKKLDPSVKIGQCLNILVLLQNKCVLDARWPMESCAESSFGHFSSRSVGKICTSGKFCQWSCVGFGYRLHTPIGTWYPRRPTLFGEICFHLYAKNLLLSLMFWLFSYICLCRSYGRSALK